MHTNKKKLPDDACAVIMDIRMGEQGVEKFIGEFLADHPGSTREMAVVELDKHRIDGDSFQPSLLPFLVHGGVSVSYEPGALSSAVAHIVVSVR